MRQERMFYNDSKMNESGFLMGYKLSNQNSDHHLEKAGQKLSQPNRVRLMGSGLTRSAIKIDEFFGLESPLSLHDSLDFKRKPIQSDRYLPDPDPNVFERYRQVEEENLKLKKQLSLGNQGPQNFGPDESTLETKISDLKAALLILEAENACLQMENFELRDGKLGLSEISTIDCSPLSVGKTFEYSALHHSKPDLLTQTTIYKQKLDFAVKKRDLEQNYVGLKKGLADNETLTDLELLRFKVPQLELQISELSKEKERLEKRVNALKQR